LANFDHFSGSIATAATSILADSPACTGAYVLLYGAAHAGITVNFEGTIDGGATWIPIAGYRVDAVGTVSAVTSVALGSNSQNQYYLMVGAFNQIRVRSSAYTSGTLTVSIMTVLDADPVRIDSATSNFTTPAALADTVTNPTVGSSGALAYAFNNTTWDRFRNNEGNITVDSSGARTTTGVGTTGVNFNHTGVFIFINVTAATGTTPTLVLRVQWSGDNGTTWFDLDTTNAQTASITTTGTFALKVYPGLTAAANAACNSPLPRTWRLAWTIGGTTPSFTFQTLASYIL
jgi:hypothetical protein